VLAFRQGDNDQVRAHQLESLALARHIGDRKTEADALGGLARVGLREHDFVAVREQAKECSSWEPRRGEVLLSQGRRASADGRAGDRVRARRGRLETWRRSSCACCQRRHRQNSQNAGRSPWLR
jgi:hypothetical protein